jgi:hypothetical protein
MIHVYAYAEDGGLIGIRIGFESYLLSNVRARLSMVYNARENDGGAAWVRSQPLEKLCIRSA